MSQKKIHRFLLSHIPEEKVFTIDDVEQSHHILNVLRLDIGETIALFTDDTPDQFVTITEKKKKTVTVKKTSTAPSVHEINRDVIAVISIIKHDNFDMVVQKLTELGIYTIVPLIADRSIKQSVRLERLQAISDEALEQCGGNRRIVITEPKRLEECLKDYPFVSFALLPGAPLLEKPEDSRVVLYVGPEGGWSDKEEQLFAEKLVKPLGLGPRILRAETAAIVGAFYVL